MGCLLTQCAKKPANDTGVGSISGLENRSFTDIEGGKCLDRDEDSRRSEHMRYREPPSSFNKNRIEHQETESTTQVVRALWNREINEECYVQEGELNFKAGELLEIIKSDDDWWLARKVGGTEEGYIPSNFVEKIDNPLGQPWFHGKILRLLAEKRLMEDDNDIGTFLIRESENQECKYAISILTDDTKRNKRRVVKHYRIKVSSDMGYYITPQRTFETLLELVTGYQGDSQGLCCELTLPCPKTRPGLYDLNKSAMNNPEISFSDLKFIEPIAQGQFGEVWKGKYKGRQDVAIKKLKEGAMTVDKFLEEAMVMKTLRHERLVALLAVCCHENTHYIITELLRESLLNFLRNSPEQQITSLYHIASQVAEGMAYMESHDYIHRDLAARNILMVNDLTVKIGDFGLARVILEEEGKMYLSQGGTKIPIKWTAPEGILDSTFTIKSDVWAYGILLVELTSKGNTPYTDMKNSILPGWLSIGNRHPRPIGCPEVLYNLMLRCWDKEPDNRPSFEKIFTEMQQILKDHINDEDDASDPYNGLH